jgi:raffinose/stachyose/melibiose transport system permease protein
MTKTMHKGLKFYVLQAIKWIFMIFMALFAAFPIVQVIFNSFRSDQEVKLMPLGLPQVFTLANYPDTWKIGGYGIAYINSILTASVVICAVLIVVGLGAYALSKLQFRMRGFFTAYFFVAISLPSFLYIVPDYFIMNHLGLVNTRWCLMIVYTGMQIPFNMLLLKTFLGGIPRELEEAAKIDGCSELQSLTKITVPIAKPMFLTIGILLFVSVWNEFLWSNTFISSDNLKMVATRFVMFTGQYGSNMARIYTASVITIAPVVLLYLIFSQKFIEGMTSGSVKG